MLRGIYASISSSDIEMPSEAVATGVGAELFSLAQLTDTKSIALASRKGARQTILPLLIAINSVFASYLFATLGWNRHLLGSWGR